MKPPLRLTPEALLAHSDWMRRLVARLVYEPGLQEDVLQETWLIAMQRAPQDLAEPRAWLAKVALNVSRNWGRSDGRRRRREEAVARLEALPDTVDVVEKANLQGRMVAAVLALDEPYRTPVLLRFFEDLAPREIAKRLGRPVNTVRSQIGRGLALLRTQLDSEFGDRDSWGMAFLPLLGAIKAPVAGGSQLVKAGVGIMSMKWIMGLAAVALGLFAWKPWGGESLEDNRLRSAAIEQTTPVENHTSKTELSNPAGVPERAGASSPPIASVSQSVEITFLDPVSGEPASGIHWWVMRTGSFDQGQGWYDKPKPDPLSQGTTHSDGVARFPKPDDALVHLCTDRTAEYARGSWPLTIDASLGIQQRVPLSLGTTIRGRILDGGGRPQAGVQVQARLYSGVPQVLAVSDSAGKFEAQHMANFPRAFVFDKTGRVLPTRTERTSFFLSKPGVSWVRFSGKGFSRHLPNDAETHPAEIPVYDAGDFVVEQGYMLRGSVFDGSGAPISGALVSPMRVQEVQGDRPMQSLHLPWEEGGELSSGECLTDDGGRFSLEILHTTRRHERLAFFAPGMAPAVALIPSAQPDGTREPMRVTLEPDHGFNLRLVDPQEPGGSLLRIGTQRYKLLLRPDLPGSALGGRLKTLNIPENGEVPITRSLLQADRAIVTLIVDGYEPAEAELDLAQPGKTVELVARPRIQVTVEAQGPGAEKTTQVDLLICALPPLNAEEAELSSLNGEAGSRSIGIMDYGQLDHLFEGAPIGEGVDIPWPMAQSTWVYIRPTGRDGYEPMPVSAFGPFQVGEDEVTCKLEVPDWVVEGSQEGDGDGAGLIDNRGYQIRARVVSADSGEPIEDAEFMRVIGGKHRGTDESDADGVLETAIGQDEADCRIFHPLYRPLFLGPIEVRHGESIDWGELALEPLNLVQGQLLDHAGLPLRESRRISWDDPELGLRWGRSTDDGSFELGMPGPPPTWIRVFDGDSPRRIWAKVDLFPGERNAETGEVGPMTGKVPTTADVVFEIHGLDANIRNTYAPIFLVGPDGAHARMWQDQVRGGVALFDTALPPGTYTLVSGWVISIPPTTIDIKPGPHVEPLIFKVRGGPVVR